MRVLWKSDVLVKGCSALVLCRLGGVLVGVKRRKRFKGCLMSKGILVVFFLVVFSGCSSENNYSRFSRTFVGMFDTFVSVIGYSVCQDGFDYFVGEVIYPELSRLNKLFDGFSLHYGVNNVKTINQNAGVGPVYVSPEIIDLLNVGLGAYFKTGGVVNVAIGPITGLWQKYHEPDMYALEAASEFIDISRVIVGQDSVFLPYKGMSLDVVSIAKGFAVEHVTQKALAAGFSRFSLSIGGDVRLTDAPPGRDAWGVGIVNPHSTDEIYDAVFVKNTAVFTSGNYLRYNHIINPKTLKPANLVGSATVIHPSAVTAEILSLAAFILGRDDVREIIEYAGADIIWID